MTETPDEGGLAESLHEWTPHPEELRKRIIAVLVVFCFSTLAAFALSSHIAAFLTAPLVIFQVELYTFAPAEKFMAYLHLSAWTGILCTTPFFSLQTALFLWPGLRGKEHRYLAGILFVVPVLFVLGAALSYRFLAPVVFGFFLSFGADDGVRALWGLREYLALLFDLMLATGLMLQMPLALFVLLFFGIISPESVARWRPHIILLIFFIAAVLTPPDVVSQILMGVPLYLLFEGALLLGRLLRRKRGS